MIRRGLEPTDEYSPEHYVSSYSGPPRDLTQRLATTVTVSHDLMMLEYYSAADSWLAARDNEACGHAAEEADFARDNPRPLLKDFMKLQDQYSQTVQSMRFPGFTSTLR